MRGPGVLFLFLQLCSVKFFIISMATSCHLPKHVLVNTYHHLKQLGKPFPSHCRSYNLNISFPDAAIPAAFANHSQCHQASWVVFETFRQAEFVFMENELPDGVDGVTWDENKLEGFLILQNRLLEEGQCLLSAGSSHALSQYFVNVTSAIQEMKPCGWEVLRKDLIWVLKASLLRHHSCFTEDSSDTH